MAVYQTKSIEIGAKPLVLLCGVLAQIYSSCSKKRYSSTNLAIRLSPSFSLATSGMLIYTKDVWKDWNFKFRKRRTWLAGALEPQLANTVVSGKET